jgi:hypothetical protein
MPGKPLNRQLLSGQWNRGRFRLRQLRPLPHCPSRPPGHGKSSNQKPEYNNLCYMNSRLRLKCVNLKGANNPVLQ